MSVPPNTPAELVMIQDQIDDWVERGVVLVRRLSQGAKSPKKVFYRVAHPWELTNPEPSGKRKHMHDWRHDLTKPGRIYCGGCPSERQIDVEDFADPRVIHHRGDGVWDE